MTIWKFPVPIADEFTLGMPEGATCLTVQMQDGELQLWALVNPKNPIKHYSFCWFGTGHSMSESIGYAEHVGTVQFYSGALVFHLFCLGDDK